jgi:aldose 1-epimerase
LIEASTVEPHRLRNVNGMEVAISPLGGIIQAMTAPDRHGRCADVVLGFDTAQEYRGKHPYFGALVGRYANRIGNSRIEIDGTTYHLTRGKGGHHLHGGTIGFDKAVWHVEAAGADERSLTLSHVSSDGDQGYPGELRVTVVYALSDNDELSIRYSATTDKTTVINLTNHSYVNLAGAPDILDHVIELNADAFTPVNSEMIPTGEVRSVSGTPMDLREPTRIGDRIEDDYEQLRYGGGFDHNWVLNRTGEGLEFAARAYEPDSGRILEVLTTEPGIQFYTGNNLDGRVTGKGGRAYPARSGLCLETQHFPDSPNHSSFPSTILRPGETFASETVYRFRAA